MLVLEECGVKGLHEVNNFSCYFQEALTALQNGEMDPRLTSNISKVNIF
jgi:hypothetical protein